MHIDRATIRDYGPFAEPAELRLDPEVTVLTGPNDVGKSSVLNLLSYFAANRWVEWAAEHEFNIDALHDEASDWHRRHAFGATFTLTLKEPVPAEWGNIGTHYSHAAGTLAPGPSVRGRLIDRLSNTSAKSFTPAGLELGNGVRSVRLPVIDRVRDFIELKSPNPIETRLLRRAFGRQFNPATFGGLPQNTRLREMRSAERKLNAWTDAVFPAPLGLQWTLRGDNPEGIAVALQDAHQGLTPLAVRGGGVRSLVSTLAHLLDPDYESGHWLILFDEPETSLHPDAQHRLRRVLEGLGAKPTVQVVYATHSPSMINPLRPGAVRLLSRAATANGRATTRIDNEPFRGNYLPVRASLGLTPADSLLYAAVTVIAEGRTEVVGLPLLLLRLHEAGVAGFERVPELLPNVAVVDGFGSDFENLLRVSKAQGANPVLFLDGDMRRKVTQTKFREAHPDIPAVLIDGAREFEQLVPADTYFRAVADEVGAAPGQVTAEAFQTWDAARGVPSPKAFTKRVDDWLESLGLPDLNKPAVLRRAVGLADPAAVDAGPLLELVRRIEAAFDRSGG